MSHRKGSIADQLRDAARDARAGGPFSFLIFLLFGGLPIIGFVYIILWGILGLFGIDLPAPQTSVE